VPLVEATVLNLLDAGARRRRSPRGAADKYCQPVTDSEHHDARATALRSRVRFPLALAVQWTRATRRCAQPASECRSGTLRCCLAVSIVTGQL
jgi:hypothetical protein